MLGLPGKQQVSIVGRLLCLAFAVLSTSEPSIRPQELSGDELIWLKEGSEKCFISVPQCSRYPQLQGGRWDSVFAATFLDVDASSRQCLPRAIDWFYFCENEPSQVVTVIYNPTGESQEYPSTHHCNEEASESCPVKDDHVCETGTQESRKVSLVITGQTFRFMWTQVAQNAVAPLVREGHEVDVFVFLSRDDSGGIHNSDLLSQYQREKNGLIKEEEVITLFRREVERNGGTLTDFQIGDQWKVQDVEASMFSQWEPLDRRARVQQYVGWYRAWQSVKQVEVSRRQHYDVVILQRSDLIWLSEFPPLCSFRTGVSHKRVCGFGGLHDKVFIMTREHAAPLMEAVTTFYINTDHVSHFYSNEVFLMRLVFLYKLPLHGVDTLHVIPKKGLTPRNFSTSQGKDGGCFTQVNIGPNCECVPAQFCEDLKKSKCTS